MKFPIEPKYILIALVVITILLAALSVGGQYYVFGGGDNEMLLKLAGKLDLDGEKNSLPTWFQSSVMLICAVLLFAIAIFRQKAKDRDFRYWGFISLVFVYLSLDESISIHEQATVPLRQGLDLGGIFFMSWVVPVGIFALLFFVFSLRFLSRLPARTRWLMIIAGGVYISGALLMEMIDGAYYEVYIESVGKIDWNYVLMTTVEESLEMLGLSIFVYALIGHLFSAAVLKPAEAVSEKASKANPDPGLSGFQTDPTN